MAGEGSFIDGLMVGDVKAKRNLEVAGTAAIDGKLIRGASALFETLADDRDLTAADSDKTFFLNLAGGFTVTLPAPALGLNYKFIVKAAPTTAYIITTPGTTTPNIIQGTIASGDLDASADTTATALSDTITFVANKAAIGDSLDLVSDGTSWFARGFCKAVDGLTFTQAT